MAPPYSAENVIVPDVEDRGAVRIQPFLMKIVVFWLRWSSMSSAPIGTVKPASIQQLSLLSLGSLGVTASRTHCHIFAAMCFGVSKNASPVLFELIQEFELPSSRHQIYLSLGC
jgi:hypothetical protein